MARYARIENDAVVEIREFAKAPDPNPAKGFDWRPYTLIKPTINSATQVYDPPDAVRDVQPESVTDTWTARDKTAQELANDLAAFRDRVTTQFDNTEDIVRALALVVLAELNSHTVTINAILAAADGATNLATFKSAVAAITDQPTRTAADLRAAIRAKLGNGI